MSKFTKNSGFNRQEAVMGQFRKDRLSKIENSTVARCLEIGREQAEYRAKMAAKLTPRFVK
jgi:hypothetical protein